MEPIMIVVAFIGGLVAMAVRLPPLVGFLVSGFVLNAMGFQLTEGIQTIAELGVTLLLFTIGLKLHVRTLMRGEVWGAATLHVAASTGVLMGFLAIAKALGVVFIRDASWQTLALLGFTLSFSSTVFVMKVLEDRGESRSLYGRVSIGVLVMQDIFAVIFLTVSTGKLPSPWALLLLLLLPGAWVLRQILDRLGHGEMQVLYGVMLALVLGYALFEHLGIKGDLGALIIGMLLAPHPQAASMSKSLFDMKELFLVGFFLSIGLAGLPTWSSMAAAAVLLLCMPLCSLLYVVVFSLYRLRPRTNILATLALSNFSEFGLIVGALAVANDWLSRDWLVVLSLAVALSFVVAAPLNSLSEAISRRIEPFLPHIDPKKLHPSDRPIEVGDAQVIIVGMGRVGAGAYERLSDRYGMRVLGIDTDHERVQRLRDEGVNVVEGDAVDADFWDKLVMATSVELVMLCMPAHDTNIFALDQLKTRTFHGRIAAMVKFADHIDLLRDRGADVVHHLYEEAGQGMADDAAESMGRTIN
ncbi:MAG: cation:proton antiporter [Nocardiaceae bacterium]|nr:cation:proton antiporter [Nocardiaceae bacterium]